MSKKIPMTWAEFKAWAEKPMHGGPLCKCTEENCMAAFPSDCPSCGGPLKVGVHLNAPTLIIGCEHCGLGVAYLQLVSASG